MPVCQQRLDLVRPPVLIEHVAQFQSSSSVGKHEPEVFPSTCELTTPISNIPDTVYGIWEQDIPKKVIVETLVSFGTISVAIM